MKKLMLKVGLRNIYLEQFHTFTDPARDPRYRAVTIGYLSIGQYHDIKKYSQYGEVAFHPLRKLPALAFDHKEIVMHAYRVLRHKLLHSNIAQFFLPKHFTLQQLQEVYDGILGVQSDVRNFRTYIKKANVVVATGKKEVNVSHRPAELYGFVQKDVKVSDYGW
jgi:8-oxo-dGTP diphosphatase